MANMSEAKYADCEDITTSTNNNSEVMSLDDNDTSVGNGVDVHLVFDDGKTKMTVKYQVAKLSKMLKAAISSDSDTTVDVKVSPRVGKIIVKYLQHQYSVLNDPEKKMKSDVVIEKPLHSSEMKNVCVDEWHTKFYNSLKFGDRQTLYDLITAANYLAIEELLHNSVAVIASLMRGISVEECKNIVDPKLHQMGEDTDFTE